MEKTDKKQENITFYHVGKVVKVINKDNAINLDKKSKAVIEMWDNNVVTCEVLSNNVKDDSFVIVQFNGVSQNQGMFMKPVTITDVLKKEAGQEIWDKYKGFLDKSKPTHPFTG